MFKKSADHFLLYLSAATLFVGLIENSFSSHYIAKITWAIGGIAGLLPATMWMVRGFRNRQMESDVLAVLSLVGTLLTGEMFASSMISLMLATGRVLERWAEGQAERQLKSLLLRMPRRAHLVTASGSLMEIATDDIQIGQKLLVRSGEVVPTDGELLTSALLDESALTGEAMPCNREAGEVILSGVLNTGSNLEFTSTSRSQESTYAGIIRLVQSAQARTAPSVRVANRWAAGFIPIAILTAAVAWVVTGEVSHAVAVLVTATPCPLILAVPIAIVAGMSQAARHGAVIKGGAALELLARTETVLFDKTGTLTHGGPSISQVDTSPELSENRVLQIAASLDQYSTHIVARAIVSESKNRGLDVYPATDIHEEHGHGITGTVDGAFIKVGQLDGAKPKWLTFNHPLMVGVSINGTLVGVLGLVDPLRRESKAMIEHLRSTGVSRILLVSGDRIETVQQVADAVGISEVYASTTAAQKMQLVEKQMRETTGVVVVVGDGINDAPALAAAHVGVAMGARGATAASEAADVVIVEDSIERLTRAISIAKRARRKAIQAAGIGIFLSFVAMVAGAGGALNPSQGAVTQEFIDVIAILWALTTLHESSAQ